MKELHRDCARRRCIALYSPSVTFGYEVWNWRSKSLPLRHQIEAMREYQ
jgi:hypothetical protein